MADDGAPEGEPELRPCAFCGAAIDPRCHRCSECSGHVGLAWKTVDSELFGMIFASVLIGIGCLVSWSAKRPGDLHGTDTVRGAIMLAFATYGVLSGVFNVLYRRHVIWPVFLNSILAIWTGLEGILGVMGTEAWSKAGETTEQVSYFEKIVGSHVRLIPPGFLLLTAGGALVLMVVVKGLVAGAGSASAKKKSAEAAREADAEARRTRRRAGSNPDAPPEVPGGDVPPPAPPV
jgi:hypothetical protein